MDKVRVHSFNQVYDRLECDPGLHQEICDYFTFDVPNAKFSPAYRNKWWDGKIRVYKQFQGLLYCGLRSYLEHFCSERGYQVEYAFDTDQRELSLKEAREFISSLGLNPEFEEREYQVESFTKCVRRGRGLMVSPTSSGKSYLIYLLVRYFSVKTLVIVPRSQLIHQMTRDFSDYKGEIEKVHKIYAGQDKNTSDQIVVTTWHSIAKQPKAWFDQFDMIIGDEAHLFTAKSLTGIMEKTENTRFKFGFTGTLDGSKCHKLVLEGLFGPHMKVVSTKELMDQGYVSELTIKTIVLNYPDEIKKAVSTMDYQAELDFIVRLEARNQFIKNLALSLKGNTLLLCQFVEKHGTILHKMIADEAGPSRKVFFIHGGVDGQIRDEIAQIVEKETDAIIVASLVFTTGVSIKHLHNLVFTSPAKSTIQILQSIGRSLRTSKTKSSATLFDIADDLKWKSRSNYTLKHFIERLRIYVAEKFVYKMYRVNLKV
jgi:superfamily II DNA or RNA helicase